MALSKEWTSLAGDRGCGDRGRAASLRVQGAVPGDGGCRRPAPAVLRQHAHPPGGAQPAEQRRPLHRARRGAGQGLAREKTTCVVSVTDTGPGIAPEDQERLFEPFQQLDSSIRRRHGGSGLGLSISKRFVEMHGGKMWLESEVGVGTTISFSLPLDDAAARPARPGRRRRALV